MVRGVFGVIDVVPASAHFRFKNTWLNADWHFCFDRYFDPKRVNFGALRVYNHDIVAPGHGFPLHPHREMEVITYLIAGELSHEDSFGHRGILRAGEIQCLAAGRGVNHTEMNQGTAPAELLQIWILPEQSQLTPRIEQRMLAPEQQKNQWVMAASGQGLGGALTLGQDARFALVYLEAGHSAEWTVRPHHLIYLHAISGSGTANDIVMERRDAAELSEESHVLLDAKTTGLWSVVEVPPF